MRARWVLAAAILGAGVCAGCMAMREPVGQLEPYLGGDPPQAKPTGGTEWVFTSIPPSQFDARRRHGRDWIGTERGLFVRIHDGRGKPLGYVNIVCLGSRLGAMTDDNGVAWLHGMPEDTVLVRILATGYESATKRVGIGKGQLVGLDVQAPLPRKPLLFAD